MSGLRDLTAQCGQPSQLSQVANSVTSANPAILADSSAYAHGPQRGGIHMHGRSGDLAHEFQRTSHLMATSAAIQQQTMEAQQMAQALARQFEATKAQASQSKAALAQPQQQQQRPGMPIQAVPRQMMGQPLMRPPSYFPGPMPIPQQMMYRQPGPAMAVPRQQGPIVKTEKVDQKEIVTNGTDDMQSEESVREQLEKLRTDTDLDAMAKIRQVLKETSDENQQQSQFFNFLRDVVGEDDEKKADPPVQIQRPANPIDSINWERYLDSVNGLEAPAESSFTSADPDYTMNSENPHLNSETLQVMDDSIDYFAMGLKLMKNGSISEAISAFEAAVKKEPNRSEAWRHLGQCHADNEEEQNAIAAFLKCHELDPFDLDALLALGVSFTNEINETRALNYLKGWIENHTDYSVLVSEEKMSEDIPESLQGYPGRPIETRRVINLFLKALKINPKDPDLHIVLGVLYNLTNEFGSGEIHFKKALQARPEDPTLWNKLGATQANGQNYRAAIQAYSRALELKANYVRALSNLGISFANQRMHKEACQAYLASLKRNPGAESVWEHFQMSLINLGRGDLVTLVQKKDVSLFTRHFDF